MSELKADMEKINDLQSIIVSKALRCNIFLPFGLDLLNFEIVYTDNVPLGAPAATDYERVYINPDSHIFKSVSGDLTQRCILTFLLCHETFHPKLFHDKRRGKRDPELWNIAGDFVINLLLLKLERESKDLCPSSPLVDMKVDRIDGILLDDRFDTMIEEEVYDYLQKNGHFKKKQSTKSLKDFLNENGLPTTDANGNEIPDDSEIQVTETEFKLGDKEFKHTTITFPEGTHFKNDEDKKDYEDRRSLARQTLESSLSKGVRSAELKKFLGKLFKVKVDWARITKDSLMTAFEKSHEMSWGKPRMSWLANPQMPYLPDVEEEERYGVVVLAVDESGSMSDKDVIRSVDIMIQAKDYYKGLLVIKHDYVVGWTHYYPDIEEMDIDELATRRHCGGTSHKGVFEYVNQFLKENPDEMISCFIGITDMCSDIESTQDIMNYAIPRIWLANCEHKTDGIIGRIIRVDL